MKRGISLVVLLAVFVIWQFPAVAAAQGETEYWPETFYAAPPTKVKPNLDEQRPFEATEEFMQWREWVMDNVHRQPVPERRPEAFVGAAEEVVDVSPTETIDDYSAGNPEPAVPCDMQFTINHGFTAAENQSVSDVAEPTVAYCLMKKGWMTTNWSVARSMDHGVTWTYVNPYTFFTPPSGMTFCCDQEVVFDPQYNAHFWSILYVTPSLSGGCVRIAVSKNLNQWWYYDFFYSTTLLPDYPHIRLTRNYLYLTYNEFNSSGAWTRTRWARLPTLPMVRAQGFSYGTVSFTDYFNLTVAKNQFHHSVAYAATNWYLWQVDVFEWPEYGNWPVTQHTIPVTAWDYTHLSCQCPDGNDPCGRVGDRILGNVVTFNNNFPETGNGPNNGKNQMWLTWNSGYHGGFPKAYTYMVQIDMDNWTVLDYDPIYNTGYAFQYADICPMPRGDICLSVDALGGSLYTRHDVTIIDDCNINGYDAGYVVYPVAIGDNVCSNGRWGDYNCVNPWWRNSNQCTGIGHVKLFSRPQNWYTRFNRERDAGS